MNKYVQGSLTEKKTDQCNQCPVLNVQSEPQLLYTMFQQIDVL